MAERWYVVQSIPRMEGWALENIVLGGFQAYWPRYKVNVKGRPNAEKFRSLFPSYVFAAFDAKQDPWRSICTTRGVRRILGANEENATALPRGFVEMMMTDSATGVLEQPTDDRVLYQAGEQLRIVDGPLKGHVGTMKFHEKGRIALLLSLLGRENIVYVPTNRLSYAGAPL
jgi:transcription antitermination factor NusG